jgi:hypothetical protein
MKEGPESILSLEHLREAGGMNLPSSAAFLMTNLLQRKNLRGRR